MSALSSIFRALITISVILIPLICFTNLFEYSRPRVFILLRNIPYFPFHLHLLENCCRIIYNKILRRVLRINFSTYVYLISFNDLTV